MGVPYDAGANHPGTRLGPREIRNKSSVVRRCDALAAMRLRGNASAARAADSSPRLAVRRMNQATGVRPFDICRYAFAPPFNPLSFTFSLLT